MTSSKAQVCALPSETNSEIVPIEFTFTKKIQSKNFKIKSLEIGQCLKNQKKRREIPILLLETYQNQIYRLQTTLVCFVFSLCGGYFYVCTCYYSIRFSIFSLLGSLVRTGGSVQNLQIPKNENSFLGAMRKRDKRLGTLITADSLIPNNQDRDVCV